MENLILMVIGFVQLLTFCNGYETCSGRDVSNEKRFPMNKIDGLWYNHLIDDTSKFGGIRPFDANLYYMNFEDNVIAYLYGRNQSGSGCTKLIFLDRQRTHGSACVTVQLLSPAVGTRDEFVFSSLPGNDQLILSFCQNPPSCTKHVAAFLSRRKHLCPGERELSSRKFRDLRIPASLKKQQPNKNVCTVPGLENVKDTKARSCHQVIRDAFRQLRGRTGRY